MTQDQLIITVLLHGTAAEPPIEEKVDLRNQVFAATNSALGRRVESVVIDHRRVVA